MIKIILYLRVITLILIVFIITNIIIVYNSHLSLRYTKQYIQREMNFSKVYRTSVNEMQNFEIDMNLLQRSLMTFNDKEIIINKDKFKKFEQNDLILIVEVSSRKMFPKLFLDSLTKVTGVSEALLIVSYRFYDKKIVKMFTNFKNCKVLQIFYPYSTQIYRNSYPGQSKYDCPRLLSPKSKINCKNKAYPDIFGHYREAQYSQMKLHWWWTANQVFRKLKTTRMHRGYVVFLKDTDYLFPDFIQTFELMKRASSQCITCNVLVLGRYRKPKLKENVVYLSSSRWNYNNEVGMAFNRTTWKNIFPCRSAFCVCEDYNWQNSLACVSKHCLRNKLYAIIVSETRILRLKVCSQGKNLCVDDAMSENENSLPDLSEYNMSVKNYKFYNFEKKKYPFGIRLRLNGGWSDIRDFMFCGNMSY